MQPHLYKRPGVRVLFHIARAQFVNAAQQVSPTVRNHRLYLEQQHAYCFLVSHTYSMAQDQTAWQDGEQRRAKTQKEGHKTGEISQEVKKLAISALPVFVRPSWYVRKVFFRAV